MNVYKSWEQVAGYFDGDGNISISDLSNQPFKLSLSVIFTDASPEQISKIRTFFVNRGIRTSNILRTSKGTAHMIAISTHEGVLASLKAMLPHLFKKANEAQAVIDYYEGKIRGNDLVVLFEHEVAAVRRERRPHKVKIDVPFTFADGDRLMKEGRRVRLRDAIGRYRAKVTPEDYESIREEFFNQHKPLHELVRSSPRYARETIRRILGRGRGHVLVKGKGLVNTTNSR